MRLRRALHIAQEIKWIEKFKIRRGELIIICKKSYLREEKSLPEELGGEKEFASNELCAETFEINPKLSKDLIFRYLLRRWLTSMVRYTPRHLHSLCC